MDKNTITCKLTLEPIKEHELSKGFKEAHLASEPMVLKAQLEVACKGEKQKFGTAMVYSLLEEDVKRRPTMATVLRSSMDSTITNMFAYLVYKGVVDEELQTIIAREYDIEECIEIFEAHNL